MTIGDWHVARRPTGRAAPAETHCRRTARDERRERAGSRPVASVATWRHASNGGGASIGAAGRRGGRRGGRTRAARRRRRATRRRRPRPARSRLRLSAAERSTCTSAAIAGSFATSGPSSDARDRVERRRASRGRRAAGACPSRRAMSLSQVELASSRPVARSPRSTRSRSSRSRRMRARRRAVGTPSQNARATRRSTTASSISCVVGRSERERAVHRAQSSAGRVVEVGGRRGERTRSSIGDVPLTRRRPRSSGRPRDPRRRSCRARA